jgi:hypothetical protein
VTMGRVSEVRIVVAVKPVYEGTRADAGLYPSCAVFRFRNMLMFLLMLYNTQNRPEF